MAKLFKNLTLLLVPPILLFLGWNLYLNHKLGDNILYQVNARNEAFVFGNSHSAYALNDSLLNNCKNFSQPSDNFFFTYHKAKKLLEANPQVGLIFLEVTNYLFKPEEETRFYDDDVLGFKYPKYSHLFTFRNHLFLFWMNPEATFFGLLDSFKSKIELAGKASKIQDQLDWGGYYYEANSVLDSASVEARIKERSEYKNDGKTVSPNNDFRYLAALVDFCKSKRIEVVFLRSPLHPYSIRENEKGLQKMFMKHFPHIPLWDFSDFPMKNAEFYDFDHLNCKGAERFSNYFDLRLNSHLQSKNNVD